VFRTRYDYHTRYGILGKAADYLFRPLIGWATAWSFDALRLWAERQVTPESSVLRLSVYSLARATLAFDWMYQGMVPKLLFPPHDRRISEASGFDPDTAVRVTTAAGIVEFTFGVLLLLLWNKRLLLQIQIPVLFLLPLGILINRPSVLGEAFNPITLNLSMIILATLALVASKGMPSAANCRRSPGK
jgi:hypothetical protein